jgi:hypothetical protein
MTFDWTGVLSGGCYKSPQFTVGRQSATVNVKPLEMLSYLRFCKKETSP